MKCKHPGQCEDIIVPGPCPCHTCDDWRICNTKGKEACPKLKELTTWENGCKCSQKECWKDMTISDGNLI
jgi:hypothetical protein